MPNMTYNAWIKCPYFLNKKKMKKQIAKSNYPDIIEHGDAYQVRDGLNFIYGVQNIRIHPGRIVFRQPRDNV